MQENFQKKLEGVSNEYAHLIYEVSQNFPKCEMYGLISQIRRSSLSAPLNIVEGYARGRDGDKKRHFEIAYASLKESIFTLKFAKEENFEIDADDYKKATDLADLIGRMLWGTIRDIKGLHNN